MEVWRRKRQTVIISQNPEIFELFTDVAKEQMGSKYTDDINMIFDVENNLENLLPYLLEQGGRRDADILLAERLGDISEKESLIAKAMKTKQICREVCGKIPDRTWRIYGYFLLPEQRQWDETRGANAYAALQRIEYHMTLEPSVYDDIVLLSENGRESLRWFAEALVWLAGNENDALGNPVLYRGWRLEKEEFLDSDRVLTDGLLKSTVLPEDSHSYSSLGYASVKLAEAGRKKYGNLAEQLFSKDKGRGWLRPGEKMPDTPGTEQELRRLMGIAPEETFEKFWERSLLLPLWQCSQMEENPVELTRTQINFGDTAAYAQGFRMEERAKQGAQVIAENLQMVSEEVLKNAELVLEEYGPAAMEQLFYGESSKEEGSVMEILRQGFERLERVPEMKKKRPIQRITGSFSGQQEQERIAEWKHYFELAVETEICAQAALPFLWEEGEWNRLLIHPFEELTKRCGRMAQELEKEMGVQEAGELSEEARIAEGETPGFLMEWLPEDSANQMEGIQVERLKKALLCHLMNPSEPHREAADILSEALDEKDASLADCMEDFAKSHAEEEMQEKCQSFARDCMAYLLEKSAPVLEMEFESVHRRLWLILPQRVLDGKYGGFLQEEFRKYLDSHAGTGCEIIGSDCGDEILCYQSTVGNPLYELGGIAKWEQAYNRRIEGETLDWKHYFPLALRHLNKNEIQKKLQEGFFNPCVEYALKEKLIERKQMPGEDKKYLYVINLLPEDWTDLDVSGYTAWDDEGKARKGEPLFQYLQERNSFSGKIWQREILLPGSGVFSKPYDFSQTREGMDVESISLSYMKRILARNLPLFVELRRTVSRYQRIQRDIDALRMPPKQGRKCAPVTSDMQKAAETEEKETGQKETGGVTEKAAVERKLKFCKYCGKPLKRGTEKFCPSCGRILRRE